MSLIYFGENNDEFQEYVSTCRLFNNIEIYHTFSPEIKEHFNASKIVYLII